MIVRYTTDDISIWVETHGEQHVTPLRARGAVRDTRADDAYESLSNHSR